jgi:uncharacterized protein
MSWENPCVRCGACCAYFRVEFYWRETDRTESHGVPVALSEDLTDFLRCMKGTNRKRGAQCVGLRGRVGDRAVCSIYPNRPSPCRAFTASYADGKPNKRCDEARRAHGLRPLGPRDWLDPGAAPSPEAPAVL